MNETTPKKEKWITVLRKKLSWRGYNNRFINGTRGMMAVFLALIMFPFTTLILQMTQAAKLNAVVGIFDEILSNAANSTLGSYDNFIRKRFGFLCLKQEATANAAPQGDYLADIFKDYLDANVRSLGEDTVQQVKYTVDGLYPLSNIDVLQSSIKRFGKWILPVKFVQDTMMTLFGTVSKTFRLENSNSLTVLSPALDKFFSFMDTTTSTLTMDKTLYNQWLDDAKRYNSMYNESWTTYSAALDACRKSLYTDIHYEASANKKGLIVEHEWLAPTIGWVLENDYEHLEEYYSGDRVAEKTVVGSDGQAKLETLPWTPKDTEAMNAVLDAKQKHDEYMINAAWLLYALSNTLEYAKNYAGDKFDAGKAAVSVVGATYDSVMRSALIKAKAKEAAAEDVVKKAEKARAEFVTNNPMVGSKLSEYFNAETGDYNWYDIDGNVIPSGDVAAWVRNGFYVQHGSVLIADAIGQGKLDVSMDEYKFFDEDWEYLSESVDKAKSDLKAAKAGTNEAQMNFNGLPFFGAGGSSGSGVMGGISFGVHYATEAVKTLLADLALEAKAAAGMEFKYMLSEMTTIKGNQNLLRDLVQAVQIEVKAASSPRILEKKSGPVDIEAHADVQKPVLVDVGEEKFVEMDGGKPKTEPEDANTTLIYKRMDQYFLDGTSAADVEEYIKKNAPKTTGAGWKVLKMLFSGFQGLLRIGNLIVNGSYRASIDGDLFRNQGYTDEEKGVTGYHPGLPSEHYSGSFIGMDLSFKPANDKKIAQSNIDMLDLRKVVNDQGGDWWSQVKGAFKEVLKKLLKVGENLLKMVSYIPTMWWPPHWIKAVKYAIKAVGSLFSFGAACLKLIGKINYIMGKGWEWCVSKFYISTYVAYVLSDRTSAGGNCDVTGNKFNLRGQYYTGKLGSFGIPGLVDILDWAGVGEESGPDHVSFYACEKEYVLSNYLGIKNEMALQGLFFAWMMILRLPNNAYCVSINPELMLKISAFAGLSATAVGVVSAGIGGVATLPGWGIFYFCFYVLLESFLDAVLLCNGSFYVELNKMIAWTCSLGYPKFITALTMCDPGDPDKDRWKDTFKDAFVKTTGKGYTDLSALPKVPAKTITDLFTISPFPCISYSQYLWLTALLTPNDVLTKGIMDIMEMEANYKYSHKNPDDEAYFNLRRSFTTLRIGASFGARNFSLVEKGAMDIMNYGGDTITYIDENDGEFKAGYKWVEVEKDGKKELVNSDVGSNQRILYRGY